MKLFILILFLSNLRILTSCLLNNEVLKKKDLVNKKSLGKGKVEHQKGENKKIAARRKRGDLRALVSPCDTAFPNESAIRSCTNCVNGICQCSSTGTTGNTCQCDNLSLWDPENSKCLCMPGYSGMSCETLVSDCGGITCTLPQKCDTDFFICVNPDTDSDPMEDPIDAKSVSSDPDLFLDEESAALASGEAYSFRRKIPWTSGITSNFVCSMGPTFLPPGTPLPNAWFKELESTRATPSLDGKYVSVINVPDTFYDDWVKQKPKNIKYYTNLLAIQTETSEGFKIHDILSKLDVPDFPSTANDVKQALEFLKFYDFFKNDLKTKYRALSFYTTSYHTNDPNKVFGFEDRWNTDDEYKKSDKRAMCLFYHWNWARDFIISFFYDDPNYGKEYRSLLAVPHYDLWAAPFALPSPAATDTWNRFAFFGKKVKNGISFLGNMGNSAHSGYWDPSVIYHEYMHAVFFQIASFNEDDDDDGFKTVEAIPMNNMLKYQPAIEEGVADYFSCAMMLKGDILKIKNFMGYLTAANPKNICIVGTYMENSNIRTAPYDPNVAVVPQTHSFMSLIATKCQDVYALGEYRLEKFDKKKPVGCTPDKELAVVEKSEDCKSWLKRNSGKGACDYTKSPVVCLKCEQHTLGEILASTLWELQISAKIEPKVILKGIISVFKNTEVDNFSFQRVRDCIIKEIPDEETFEKASNVFARHGMGYLMDESKDIASDDLFDKAQTTRANYDNCVARNNIIY